MEWTLFLWLRLTNGASLQELDGSTMDLQQKGYPTQQGPFNHMIETCSLGYIQSDPGADPIRFLLRCPPTAEPVHSASTVSKPPRAYHERGSVYALSSQWAHDGTPGYDCLYNWL
ncbi:unnamed protein product [Cuscuta campestris]|uniref:Neprosin domain-containing protein n=1 Tax=Cuscuta campestris TaxID=132261 RepID=A0A484MQN3_9ASTE|nr:unnamed protein product [Cuscuta campestris]